MDQGALEAEVRRRDWFHHMEIAPGLWTNGPSRPDPPFIFQQMQLPKDMPGLRALDMGCADGAYSFELVRRGADVTAVDLFPADYRNVEFLSGLWALPITYVQSTVYEFTSEPFDLVLAMGVLYHLQHPLLGLQRLNELARETVILETHVSRGWGMTCRFYPRAQLNRDPSNWWSPTTQCLRALLEVSGFTIEKCVTTAPQRRLLRLRKVRAVKVALSARDVFQANFDQVMP